MKVVRIKEEFKKDYISRAAGERLRRMILQAVKNKEGVEIDFGNRWIASTSFFDEGFAKLALEGWTKEDFDSHIHLKNINTKDRLILEKLCLNRNMK